MSPVKKEEPFFPLVERNEAVDLFKLLLFKEKYLASAKNVGVGKEDRERFIEKYFEIEKDFE